jgi:chromosome segregation ATPase
MSTVALEESRLPIAADDFNALEQRVLRMIDLLKREREARAAAEEHSADLEKSIRSLEESGLNARQRVVALEERVETANRQLADLTSRATESAEHLQSLEQERETVRGRVERLLRQLDEVSV